MERLKIHERIGILRAKQGMSGEEFAAALGLEGKNRRSTINNWESGTNNIKANDIERICRRFNVSADWLLGISEENNYTDNQTVKLISDYTGLSTEAVERIHNLDKGNHAVLSKIIERDITGVLDALETALTACESVGGKATKESNDLCFDEKNNPYIKLSPQNTISFFMNEANRIFSIITEIIISEKKIKENEKHGKSMKKGAGK